VDFKLHAPQATTVEVEYRDGRLRRCELSPPERAQDVIMPTFEAK
jgi:hypothetical protein